MDFLERHVAKLVYDWKDDSGISHRQELEQYSLRALDDAIECLFRDESTPSGKHSHQFRIAHEVLGLARKRLLESRGDIASCKTFVLLYGAVKDAIARIPGVGPLMVYDAALRLGASMNVSPDEVYLQQGTLDGARELFRTVGMSKTLKNGSSLPKSDFEPWLTELDAAEIENFLCVMCNRMDPKQPYGKRHSSKARC